MVAFTIDEYTDDLTQTRGVQGIGRVLDASRRRARSRGSRTCSVRSSRRSSPGATMSISFFRITPTEIEFIDNRRAGAGPPACSAPSSTASAPTACSPGCPRRPPRRSRPRCSRSNAEADTVIARQGGPADKFFIVVDGEIEVTREEGGIEPDGDRRLARASCSARWRSCSTGRAGTSAARPSRPSCWSWTATTFRDVVAQSLGTTADFDQVIRDRLGGRMVA